MKCPIALLLLYSYSLRRLKDAEKIIKKGEVLNLGEVYRNSPENAADHRGSHKYR